MSKVFTTEMELVYKDENGELHTQPWGDLVSSGTLTDPETGDDMDIIGWFTNTVNISERTKNGTVHEEIVQVQRFEELLVENLDKIRDIGRVAYIPLEAASSDSLELTRLGEITGLIQAGEYVIIDYIRRIAGGSTADTIAIGTDGSLFFEL